MTIHLCTIDVSNYIHPATIEAAIQVASNLRPEDRREVEEGHGLDPMEQLTLAVHRSNCVWFEVPNGKTAGMAGVEPGGNVWMLCTPAIIEYPVTFAREAKRFIERQEEPILWNIVDKRNKVHLRLLKFLGFEFLEEISHGPNNLSFIEFCRVRT